MAGKSHQLMKKHSQTDLVSRLKTRKVLGVGEDDDGEVHRSKVSAMHYGFTGREGITLWSWQHVEDVCQTWWKKIPLNPSKKPQ